MVGGAFINRSYTSQTAESDLNTGQKYRNECSLLELYVLILHLCVCVCMFSTVLLGRA